MWKRQCYELALWCIVVWERVQYLIGDVDVGMLLVDSAPRCDVDCRGVIGIRGVSWRVGLGWL